MMQDRNEIPRSRITGKCIRRDESWQICFSFMDGEVSVIQFRDDDIDKIGEKRYVDSIYGNLQEFGCWGLEGR